MSPRRSQRLRRLLAGERGFTMVVVLGVLAVVVLLSFATFTAVQADIGPTRADLDQKKALAAAEAGINDYLFHLSQDNAYWSHCNVGLPQPNAVNQVWNGQGADPRVRRNVPDSDAQYAIELLPANGFARCDPTNARSMVDGPTGTIRIRSTGFSRGAKRSLIASFRPRTFLDFLYMTNYETSDPAWYPLFVSASLQTPAISYPTSPDISAWASTHCARPWPQRNDSAWTGWYYSGRSWQYFPGSIPCDQIQFASGDQVNGPFHTNDSSILVCNGATFGRNAQDSIEVVGAKPGWRPCTGGAKPNFVGTPQIPSSTLPLPSSNSSLFTIADPAYRFTGTVWLTFNSSGNITMNYYDSRDTYQTKTMAPPANGVIYVSNGSCGQGYNPVDPYSDPHGCADVYVKGTYNQSVTIASDKDIIVNGNLVHQNDALMGLIANNFVRVYHPVSSCQNASGYIKNVQIDAAILALRHSFTVDNYTCGSSLGTLTVNGAIAQMFRGPVGTGSGGGSTTGFIKNYTYDDRLAFRQPPYFLAPVNSPWRIQRETEQVPAT